jgi:hypothetical protein
MQRMADQFTQALVDHVKGANPGRTEQERMRERRQAASTDQPPLPDETAREDDGYSETTMTWPGNDSPATTDGAGASGASGSTETTADGSDGGMFGMAGAFGEAGADSGGTTADSEATTPDASDTATDGGTRAGGPDSSAVTRGFDSLGENPLSDRATDAFEDGRSTRINTEAVEDAAAFTRELADDLADLDIETRQMLRYYRDHGPGTPIDALFAAGGSEDRTEAYARNRRLRLRGVIEHVGRGRYDYRVPEHLRVRTDSDDVTPLVEQVESVLDGLESDSPNGRD